MLRPIGLQDRILAWYGGTVLAVLGLVLVLVHIQVSWQTNNQVVGQMDLTQRAVQSLQAERIAALGVVALLLSDEPRLGAAMATDLAAQSRPSFPPTIDDLLRHDLQPRVRADFIRVTNVRAQVLADTSGHFPVYTDLAHDPATQAALRGSPSPGVLVLPGTLYLVATAPIRTGGQDLGTVTVGRRVSDDMAAQMRDNTRTEITFFAGRQLAASSWPNRWRPGLLSTVRPLLQSSRSSDGARSFWMVLDGQRLMSRLIPIPQQDGPPGMMLIQSSLDAALQPYTNIQRALAAIGLVGLMFAVLGSVVVAGGITRPLQRIARAAHGLMQGDWSQRAPVISRDEVGLLAETFNRMAERLESWDSDLRAAVAERTRELHSVVAQLDTAYQKMRQFNADASHELRTPLTVIRGEAEVALRAERSGSEYQGVLRTIQDETERMSRIVEQLLLLARVDSGELRLEQRPVALDDLLREVMHRAEVLARARRIRLRADVLEPLLLRGDEDQLARLALNLVDNAIKYTPEGGEVRIGLRAGPAPAGSPEREALLEVCDTGIGISPDDLPRIFDRFYRVDKARSRAQGGSGLGLAICRWIVEAHDGRIEVQSRPGCGSSFMVRLPGAAAPACDDSAEFEEGRDSLLSADNSVTDEVPPCSDARGVTEPGRGA